MIELSVAGNDVHEIETIKTFINLVFLINPSLPKDNRTNHQSVRLMMESFDRYVCNKKIVDIEKAISFVVVDSNLPEFVIRPFIIALSAGMEAFTDKRTIRQCGVCGRRCARSGSCTNDRDIVVRTAIGIVVVPENIDPLN